MLTLTFETANFGASAALFEGETLLAQMHWEATHGQGAYLVGALKDMVEAQGKALLDVGQVITTVGPGSFTGQRIGLAVAKTLAFAGHINVWGVSSFVWMAAGFVRAHADHTGPFLVCLDTGRADRFCQLYGANAQPQNAPFILSASDLDARISQDIPLVGQPWGDHPRAFQTTWVPHAKDLMGISPQNALPLEPLYLREANTTL